MIRLNDKTKMAFAHFLISGAFIFSLGTAVLSLFIYVIGNFQDFTESNMFMLLKLIFINGILLIVLALLSIIFASAAFFAHRDIRHLSFIILYGLFAVFGLILFFISGSIIVLMDGRHL